MRAKSSFALLVISISSSALAADITLELPDLVGNYEARPDVPPSFGVLSRHMIVTLPPELDHIDSLRFLISGEYTPGWQHCEGGEPPTPYYAAFVMGIFYGESYLDCFLGSIWPSAGAFDSLSVELEFSGPGEPANYDSLLSRPLEITLDCSGFTYCDPYIDCYGTITDVQIDIRGSVITEARTLGEIKALFR